MVDAAMRQINQTGFMHNRLPMVVTSFLVKDLLIDWRWGEQYFADNLNDFDPDGKFILRYLPELKGLSGEALHAPWLASSVDITSAGIVLGKQYPKPVAEHAAARVKALAMYGLAKGN